MTVMGDALRDRLSDRGSIPLRSIKRIVVLDQYNGPFLNNKRVPLLGRSTHLIYELHSQLKSIGESIKDAAWNL